MLTEQLTSYEDRVSPLQGAPPPSLVISLGNHQASPPPSPNSAPPSPGPRIGSTHPPRSPCPSLGKEESSQGRLLQVESKDAPTRSSVVSLGRELQEISLSTRQDLVEGLDAASIYDYLVKHGVLDPDTATSLSQERDVRRQNRALLQHLESVGGKSVQLFINALRQSGQMHLASSLDTTQRIKPVSGKGYWEKQRHKGQVTIKVHILSMKILAPRDDGCTDEKISLEKDLDAAALARRQNASYENMTMLDTGNLHSSGRKIQYSYEDDEDEVKPKNRCLCLCFPMFRKRKKNKEKKYTLNGGGSTNSSHPIDSSHSTGPTPVNGDNRFRERSDHRGSVSSPSRGGNSNRSPDKERKPSSSSKKGSSSKKSPSKSTSRQGERASSEDWMTEGKRSLSPWKEANVSDGNRRRNNTGGSVPVVRVQNGEDKENYDPIIMEYNGQLELVEMKRLSQVRSSPRMSKVELVEAWRSSGKYFQERAAEFYSLFDQVVQNAVIKYFEQDRGTLVLQAYSDKQGIFIYNICMRSDQVERLREDHTSNKLHAKLEKVLIDETTLKALDIRGIQLGSVIDDSEFAQALADLS